MPKLVSFFVCDSINNIPAGNGAITTIVAPQIVLRPQFIPGNFSFGCVIGVADVDLQADNKMRFTIVGPDGAVLQDSGDAELPKVQREDTIPKEFQGIVANIDVRNLPVQSEGEYRIEIFINSESVGTHPIPIFKG